MIAYVVGNFLVSENIISSEQLSDVLREQKRVRAKLGLIAVSEGVMTYQEATTIFEKSSTDKEFATYAIEDGYLSEGQIRNLLKRQGNAYMSFAQTLENQQLVNIEQLEQYLIDFQIKNSMTLTDLEDLKSDDINRILPMYFPDEASAYLDAACVAVRMLIRYVDADIYPLKAYLTERFEAKNGVFQNVKGEKEISFAILGKEQELTLVASRYMRETFTEIDEDTLDAVAELVNCISGMYATELSQTGLILDMFPPSYYVDMSEVSAQNMLVLPLVMKKNVIYILIHLGNEVDIK